MDVPDGRQPSGEQLEWLAPDVLRSLPDFLIISPPKTGSTWLSDNLRCHPGIFVPPRKELRYFGSLSRSIDLHWYARQFRSAGERRRGEASPSYALLPVRMIRRLRTLLPDLKLIFLMRDPVPRAWSHARHNYRYHEANFRNCSAALEEIRDAAWRENFRHPWPLHSGDYLGQLQRWLAVFPRDQIFVDLYEQIAADPLSLLGRICRFLGVQSDRLDWSSFPIHETILPGLARPLPDGLKQDLRHLLQDRSRQLAGFLRGQFGLEVEAVWGETFAPTAASPAVRCESLFCRDLEDDQLDRLLDEIDLAAPHLLEEDYHGHNIVFFHSRFFLLPPALAKLEIQRVDYSGLLTRGEILHADSLQEARDLVQEQATREVLADLRRQQALLEATLRELNGQLAIYRGALAQVLDCPPDQPRELAGRLAACFLFVLRLRNSLLFSLRRRLVTVLRRLLGSILGRPIGDVTSHRGADATPLAGAATPDTL
jgi:hypothetical protein